MLYAIRAFLEFCYIARHDIITEGTLIELEDALSHFHKYRGIFQEEGIQGKVSPFRDSMLPIITQK